MRRPLRTVAAVAAAGLGVAACGGGGSTARSATVAPSWHPPAVAGGPSAATFCRLLRADYQHLQAPAGATARTIEANFAGFFAAAPGLVAEAPAAIRPSARIFITTAVDFYRAVLATDVDHTKSPAGLTTELASPETAPAVKATLAWTEANCDPDPLPKPSSATAPTTTAPARSGIGTQSGGGTPARSRTTTSTTPAASTTPATSTAG